MNDESMCAAADLAAAVGGDGNSCFFQPREQSSRWQRRQEFEEELERYLESREDTEDALERALFRNSSTSAHTHHDLHDPSDGSNNCAYGYWTTP